MFDPAAAKKKQAEKSEKKKLADKLKRDCMMLVPPDLTVGLTMDIKEIICGDPSCAPIDTVIQMVWSGEGQTGRGMFGTNSDFAFLFSFDFMLPDLLTFTTNTRLTGLPMEMRELADEYKDDLPELFPDEATLRAWHRGERKPWPPAYEPEPLKESDLRFVVGHLVECRVGPDPVTGWAPGKVIKTLYRESHWPPAVTAPYQIELDDGRLIFAPQDTDQVIREKFIPPPAFPQGGVPSSSGAIGDLNKDELSALAKEQADTTTTD
jgi:hypothetical protein